MGLQDVVRWFVPWEVQFYELLEKQTVVLHEGALVLKGIAAGDKPDAEVLAKVDEIESRGDGLVRDMDYALARTFVTPLDREDLHRLAARLDDVLDVIYLAMQAFNEYGVKEWTEPMAELAELVHACAVLLVDAMPRLRKHEYEQIIAACREIQAREKDGDAVFRKTLGALFRDPAIDAKELLRQREILEGLENALDWCQDVADVLSNIAVKHG